MLQLPITFLYIIFYREGRNERQIDKPKKVLMSYQRNQKYRETKMRLLHKLYGLEWLEKSYSGSDHEERHWFSGYKVYPTKGDVLRRFTQGKSLSCFWTKTGGGHRMHVAYHPKDAPFDQLEYLTIECNTQCLVAVSMGVHFCQFRLVSDHRKQLVVTPTTRNDLRDCIVDEKFALMLPFHKKGIDFQQQFTLAYHDWEVLICNDNVVQKGFSPVDYHLFGKSYMDQLRI